jgi:two-component system, cell cycle response regulator DivK
VIVRCNRCGESTRLRDYSPEERLVNFLCPSCDAIVRIDLAQDEVPSSSAATSFDRTPHRKRVLVADDAELVRRMAADLLQRAGYEVLAACDGLETIQRAREEHPDAIVLDLLMPKLTGFDVLREIQKDERIRRTPVLVMSGVYKEDVVAFLQQLGASGFLDKETLRENLVFRVDSMLSRPSAPRSAA